jgi:hypothetical protein
MEKIIEFLKKNWLWVVIAIAVIVYLLTRKNKTESSFRVAPSGVRVKKPTLYDTGWYNFSGSFGVIKDQDNVAYYFSNGKCGRWSLNYSQCKYIISGPGKVEGYYFYGNQFRVKKIITSTGTFDFSGDTFLDTKNVSPTNTPQENEQAKHQYPLGQILNGTITPIQTTQRTQ